MAVRTITTTPEQDEAIKNSNVDPRLVYIINDTAMAYEAEDMQMVLHVFKPNGKYWTETRAFTYEGWDGVDGEDEDDEDD